MAGGLTQLEVASSTDLATSISHPSSKWGVMTEKDKCIINYSFNILLALLRNKSD